MSTEPSAPTLATTLHGSESARAAPPTDGGAVERGDMLDRYLIVGELGRGGSGAVYKAHDPELDRNIAIKVLRNPEADGRARLLREAQAMAKLAHPNVVAVHDVGEHGGGVFVAMQLVEGQTLAAWLDATRKDGRTRWRDVVAVFLQAGRGLAAAHDRGLTHGDFKPANVFVAEDGEVLVGDFGLARGGDGAERRQPGLPGVERGGVGAERQLEMRPVGGTPAYMAPEVHRGEPPDARSDQYSFCASLFEGLAGRRPFEGSTRAALAAEKSSAPRLRAKVPLILRRAIERGLAPDKTARHPDMPALLAVLERAPTLWRRRAVWGVGIAAGAGALALASGVGPQPCAQAGSAIATNWNPTRRDIVQTAITNSGPAFAAASARRVVADLDAYAEQWARVRDDVCRATHVRGEQSVQLLEARNQCLDEALAELEALAAVFELADTDVARASVRAVGRLFPPADCRERGAKRLALELPEDPDAVAAVRSRLAHARALERSGKYAEGLAVAKAAHEAAAQTAYEPLLAEAIEQLGALQERTGDYAQAEHSLSEAHWLAEGILHEEVAARSATRLVFVLADLQRRPDDALTWGRHAQAAVRRLGIQRQRADLLNALGAAHNAAGQLDLALERFTSALELRRELLGAAHFEVALSLSNVGSVLDRKGEPERGLPYHEESVQLVEALVGPQHPALGVLVNNLAASTHGLGRYAEARTLYARAVALKEVGLGPDHPSVAASLAGLGSSLQGLKSYNEAVAPLERALAITRKHLAPDHPSVAAALINLGNVRQNNGDLAAAERAYTEALTILRANAGGSKSHVATVLGNLGMLALKQGDVDAALVYQTDALATYKALVDPDHPDLAKLLSNLGRVHHQAGHLEKARSLYQRARAIAEAKLAPDHPDRALVMRRIAELDP